MKLHLNDSSKLCLEHWGSASFLDTIYNKQLTHRVSANCIAMENNC